MTSVVQGDWLISQANYYAAIGMYKQAGDYGAVTLGPEIDAAGAPNVTQPYTQQAWQINNDTLAPIAQQDDQNAAVTAQSSAKSIAANYQSAIAAGLAALQQPNPPAPPRPPQPPGPPKPPAPPQPPQPPPPASSQTDYTVPILVGAGVVGAGIIAWALKTRKKR